MSKYNAPSCRQHDCHTSDMYVPARHSKIMTIVMIKIPGIPTIARIKHLHARGRVGGSDSTRQPRRLP